MKVEVKMEVEVGVEVKVIEAYQDGRKAQTGGGWGAMRGSPALR